MTDQSLAGHEPVIIKRPAMLSVAPRPPLADRATIIAALRTPTLNAGELATFLESAGDIPSIVLDQLVGLNPAALWTACNRVKGGRKK